MREFKKGDKFRVLIDDLECINVEIGDIGELLDDNIYCGFNLYNPKWKGNSGSIDEYKGTKYEGHCIILFRSHIEKVVDDNENSIISTKVGYIDTNQKMNFILDFDNHKDIVCIINGKTITLDKDKLEKFLLQFVKESEE